MHQLNVFNNPKLPLRYPKNWVTMTRTFLKSLKWGYQRVTRGFADCDAWNLDCYYLNLFHETLNYFAEHHCGYPGDKEFDIDEKWTAYLKEMAQLFFQANESNDYYSTPEADKWWEWIQTHPAKQVEEKIGGMDLYRYEREESPYNKSMLRESKANRIKREADFNKAWRMLGHVFWNLWD